MQDLTETQWGVIDLLMRASARGLPWVSCYEIYATPALPGHAREQIVLEAKRMPHGLIEWREAFSEEMRLSEAGRNLYTSKFKNAYGTSLADYVLAMPGTQPLH